MNEKEMLMKQLRANAFPHNNGKVMQAIKRDTPLTYEYTGFVEAKDQVSIKSKVTGTIIKKYVNGGDYVEPDSFFTKSILGPMKPMCSMLRPI